MLSMLSMLSTTPHVHPGLDSSTSTNQRLSSSTTQPAHHLVTLSFASVCTADQGPPASLSNGGSPACGAPELPLEPAQACSRPPLAVPAVGTAAGREPRTTEPEGSSLGGRLCGLLPPWDLIYFVVLFLLAPCGRLSCVTSQIDYTHKLRCGRGRPYHQPTGQIPVSWPGPSRFIRTHRMEPRDAPTGGSHEAICFLEPARGQASGHPEGGAYQGRGTHIKPPCRQQANAVCN